MIYHKQVAGENDYDPVTGVLTDNWNPSTEDTMNHGRGRNKQQYVLLPKRKN